MRRLLIKKLRKVGQLEVIGAIQVDQDGQLVPLDDVAARLLAENPGRTVRQLVARYESASYLYVEETPE